MIKKHQFIYNLNC